MSSFSPKAREALIAQKYGMQKGWSGYLHAKVHENRLANLRVLGEIETMKTAKGIVQKESPGSAIKALTSKFGLRQDTLSRMTGFSVRAVAEWVSGKKPSAPAQRVFTEMDRLLDALSRLMEPKEVGQWLKEPNPAFDGSTPIQVIERGQADRIWRMLYYVESGEPG